MAASSVTVAYPFDTVRRRLMMMSGEGEKMYRYNSTYVTAIVDHVRVLYVLSRIAPIVSFFPHLEGIWGIS